MKTKKTKTAITILTIFTAFIMLFTLTSCGRIKIVPEVTGSLYDENAMDLKGKDLAATIIKHKSELLFIAANGQIFRWNPEGRIVNFLYNLNKQVEPGSVFYNQKDYIVLKVKSPPNQPQFMVFHVEQMKEAALLTRINAQKILGLDHELLIYLNPSNQVIFYHYGKQNRLKLLEAANDNVYNAVFKGDQVYLLTSSRLFVYHKSQNQLSSKLLKHKAASGFLMAGKSFYYGTEKRELVKASIRSGRVDWRFQVGDVLDGPPVKVGPYTVIIPEDNNIYFFNNNGTLYWWEKLNSTKLMPPLAMNENAVAFLWDNKIKFFDYKKKRVVTYTLFDWVTVRSNPVLFDEYIYFVAKEKLSEEDEEAGITPNQWLSKIGNNYGVEIKANPKYIWPKGRSIKMTLKSFNLVKPQYDIKIFELDGEGVPVKNVNNGLVFEKTLTKNEKATFVWIPKEARSYRMVIRIDAENRKGVSIEETFETLDIEKVLKSHFYKLHQEQHTGAWD
jgi:hypothetical protein